MTSDYGTRNSRPASRPAEDSQTGRTTYARNGTAGDETPGKRCRISAFRDETTGQFYAMSHEDRLACNNHCEGIVSDLQPANHRERWLATSIAEDQWRLNRARALESNIFALGMSNPMIDVDAGSPEADAAICQARVWLADGKKLQMLALYESRIRRSIEKNEKQLKELQDERKAAYNQALDEAKLLAQLAIAEGEVYVYEDECPTYPGQSTPGMKASGHGHGFGFSSDEIVRLVRRDMRLQQAARLQKQGSQRPAQMPKAA
jgi:hypothetical protein